MIFIEGLSDVVGINKGEDIPGNSYVLKDYIGNEKGHKKPYKDKKISLPVSLIGHKTKKAAVPREIEHLIEYGFDVRSREELESYGFTPLENIEDDKTLSFFNNLYFKHHSKGEILFDSEDFKTLRKIDKSFRGYKYFENIEKGFYRGLDHLGEKYSGFFIKMLLNEDLAFVPYNSLINNVRKNQE